MVHVKMMVTTLSAVVQLVILEVVVIKVRESNSEIDFPKGHSKSLLFFFLK